MTDRLKTFVTEHRQEFDDMIPPGQVWVHINSTRNSSGNHWIKSKLLGKLLLIGFSISVIAAVIVVGYIDDGTNDESYYDSSQIYTEKVSDSGSFTVSATLQDHQGENRKEPSEVSNKKFIFPDSVLTDDGQQAPNHSISIDSDTLHVPDAVQRKMASVYQKPVASFSAPVAAQGSKCGLWASDICQLPDSIKTVGSFHINGEVTYVKCDQANANGDLKAVWVSIEVDKRTTFSLKDRFTNIKLISSSGAAVNPVAISSFGMRSDFITNYKGKKFDVTFNSRMNLILLFESASIGDTIMIDNIFKATIQ